jgi:hypothetical protein
MISRVMESYDQKINFLVSSPEDPLHSEVISIAGETEYNTGYAI